MADSKREANFQDEVLTSKKSKVTDLDAENKESERKCLDTHDLEAKEVVFTKSDIQNGSNSHQGNSNKGMKNSPPEVSSSEVTNSSKSEVLHQQVGKLSSIEADAAEDKGSRHNMEDAWVVLPDATLEYPGKLRPFHMQMDDCQPDVTSFISVHILQFMMATVVGWLLNMPKLICMPMSFQQGYHMDLKAAKKSILEGFRRTDESLLQESAQGSWQDGATAVCVWILGQTVLVANIGDAKAVLARSSSSDGTQNLSDDIEFPLKAIVVTREHKAIFPQERVRIQKTGGSVGSNGRLQGRLEVSRAFGDRQFKKVGVIATPDVHSFELTEREQFLILGCDGLWGVFGPSDAVDFVQKQLKDKSSATTAARRLVREAVRERRCKDNCTAIVIVFKHN